MNTEMEKYSNTWTNAKIQALLNMYAMEEIHTDSEGTRQNTKRCSDFCTACNIGYTPYGKVVL